MSDTRSRVQPAFIAAVAAAWALMAGSQPARAQNDVQPLTPIELLACRYVDGKGAADVESLAAAFNEWMDREDAPPYGAYVLTPRARSRDVEFDLAWLGVWPSGTTMGVSMAHYHSRGADIAAAREEVFRCDTNTQYAALTLRAPADGGDFGPLEVSSCTLRVGAGLETALAGVREWVEYFSRSGSGAAHWILFPSYGEASGAGYSFKWATGYPSYEAFGLDYDEFYNGGGVDRFAELLDPLLRCDSPRLYSVRAVRAPE